MSVVMPKGIILENSVQYYCYAAILNICVIIVWWCIQFLVDLSPFIILIMFSSCRIPSRSRVTTNKSSSSSKMERIVLEKRKQWTAERNNPNSWINKFWCSCKFIPVHVAAYIPLDTANNMELRCLSDNIVRGIINL